MCCYEMLKMAIFQPYSCRDIANGRGLLFAAFVGYHCLLLYVEDLKLFRLMQLKFIVACFCYIVRHVM